MKTLFFSLIVLVSGYYLLSQTDSGQSLLGNWLPSQQIEQSTEALLDKVDSRLQDFATSQSAQQNKKIQALEQQIAGLTARLSEQQTKNVTEQHVAKPTLIAKEKKPQQPENLVQQKPLNDALNLPRNMTDIQGQTAAVTADAATGAHSNGAAFLEDGSIDLDKLDMTNIEAKTLIDRRLIRQKQAALQDIAARMEQVSLQVSSGHY
ncbi:hypothetical protein [Paraglaciecola sp.]|uniref:hypothetical protein n=1 Tax=Paraglaciecola sp. TaxID=1920173 RepID=UPI0030F404CF